MVPLAEKLCKLHRDGKIPEKILILYGVSGEIPFQHPVENRLLTRQERIGILQGRMECRFGAEWREQFREIPSWLGGSPRINWHKEGF